MRQSIDKVGTLERTVWDAVYDKLSTDPAYDADIARTKADQAVALIKQGKRNDWADLFSTVGSFIVKSIATIAVIVLICGGISFGIYSWVSSYDNDYAGIDPGSVKGFAGDAIYQWYGQDNPPPDLRFAYKTHSSLGGKPAWKSVFLAKNGVLVCAFNWSRDSSQGSTDTGHKIYKGKDCQ